MKAKRKTNLKLHSVMKSDRITTSAFWRPLLKSNGNAFHKPSEVLNYWHILTVMMLALTRRSITPRLRRRDGTNLSLWDVTLNQGRGLKKTKMMQMTNPSSQMNATSKGKCFARPASSSRSQSWSAPPSPPRSRGSLSRSTRGVRAKESGVMLMPSKWYLPLSITSPSLAPKPMI